MCSTIKKYFISLLFWASLGSCVKKYDPPSIQNTNSNYLVVDGFINASPNQSSTFVLTRTTNLSSPGGFAEVNATVSIVSKSTGDSYPLLDTNNIGIYSSALLTLSPTNQYQIKINTTNGDKYVSDFVPVKISAPIDSVTWQQANNNNVNIFVNTHDPTNSSIYYKWDFVETWQHNAGMASYIQAENDSLIFSSRATASQQIDSCWSVGGSNAIITGTSVALSQDVISQQPITTIVQNDPKLSVRYSINVRQLPLTEAAFNYWVLIEKNSQQLGSLFDPQPSQLPSNIHSTINPNEPVIGYISAVAPQEKILFISASQVSNWNSNWIDTGKACPIVLGIEPTAQWPFYANPYPDSSYVPFSIGGTGINATLYFTKQICVDCALQGGTNTRPSFW